jgi:hypothetical protein
MSAASPALDLHSNEAMAVVSPTANKEERAGAGEERGEEAEEIAEIDTEGPFSISVLESSSGDNEA